MSAPLLEATGLKKSYAAFVVTDDVSFSVHAGARLALVGPNGAGKTTLLGLLSGLIPLDAGVVRLFGQDITRATPEARVRRGLARTFQINNLFDNLTITENIYLAVSARLDNSWRFYRVAGRCGEVIERVDQVLERFNLLDIRDTRLSDVAYGRRRMVEIALALSLDPKVLLLDEPTAEIADSEIAALLDVIESLSSDLAIILVEHDMKVVRRFASEVMVLVAGARLISGPPADVMTSPEVRTAYLGHVGHTRFEEGMRRA